MVVLRPPSGQPTRAVGLVGLPPDPLAAVDLWAFTCCRHGPWARTANIPSGVQISMLVGVLTGLCAVNRYPLRAGIEIGLMMFAALGRGRAVGSILASVAGLLIAYSAGEWMP